MEKHFNLHKPESHFQNSLPYMVAYYGQICPRFESQRQSSIYDIPKVYIDGQKPLQLAHGIADLQAHLVALGQHPDTHLLLVSWNLFSNFSDAWDVHLDNSTEKVTSLFSSGQIHSQHEKQM